NTHKRCDRDIYWKPKCVQSLTAAAFKGLSDQVIDSRDAVFERLLVWSDANGDGTSQTSELKTLPQVGIDSLSLERRSLGYRRDRYGNICKFRSDVVSQDGLPHRSLYEVFLTSEP